MNGVTSVVDPLCGASCVLLINHSSDASHTKPQTDPLLTTCKVYSYCIRNGGKACMATYRAMSRELAQTKCMLNYRAMRRELNYRQAHTDADPGFLPR